MPTAISKETQLLVNHKNDISKNIASTYKNLSITDKLIICFAVKLFNNDERRILNYISARSNVKHPQRWKEYFQILKNESLENGFADCTLYCENVRSKEINFIYENECRKRDELVCLLKKIENEIKYNNETKEDDHEIRGNDEIKENDNAIRSNNEMKDDDHQIRGYNFYLNSENIDSNYLVENNRIRKDREIRVDQEIRDDDFTQIFDDEISFDEKKLTEYDFFISDKESDDNQDSNKFIDIDRSLSTLRGDLNTTNQLQSRLYINKKKKMNRRYYSRMSPLEKEIDDHLDQLSRFSEIKENRSENKFVSKYPSKYQIENIQKNSNLEVILYNLRRRCKIDWPLELFKILEIIKKETKECVFNDLYNELRNVKTNSEVPFVNYLYDILFIIQKYIFINDDCERLFFYKNVFIDIYDLYKKGKK
ncbi:hypothetical protein DMUE_2419 [Dictyocoela muelleri]|nr:hypothetical protein DMUE_2419 [Dictyocoela muelleri]